MTSLNTMSQAKSYDNASLMRTLRCCTVANTLSIGFGAQVSVVHGSASELWKALERFELFSITVSQA